MSLVQQASLFSLPRYIFAWETTTEREAMTRIVNGKVVSDGDRKVHDPRMFFVSSPNLWACHGALGVHLFPSETEDPFMLHTRSESFPEMLELPRGTVR